MGKQPSDAYPANFKPNFSTERSLTIQQPIDEVFRVLGTAEGFCRVTLLSSIASQCETLALDHVAVDGPLSDAFVRTLPPNDSGFPRQHFKFLETVKIIPGLSFLDVKVNLEGTQTFDEATKTVLYESASDKNIVVRKLRTFEEVSGGATRVSEKVEGQCNPLLKFIVEREAASAHQSQMDQYPSLFS